jgi:hypothetical protein
MTADWCALENARALHANALMRAYEAAHDVRTAELRLEEAKALVNAAMFALIEAQRREAEVTPLVSAAWAELQRLQAGQ